MRLDKDQERAVAYEGDLICVAGPGSGKTRTIVSKIVYLLKKHEEGLIGAVTYTKNAASETNNRIMELYPNASSRLMSGTFHSLAGRQLRNAGIKYRVAKDGEINYFVRSVIEKLQIDDEIEDVKNNIALIKSRIKPPKMGDMNYELYIEYENLLKKNNVYDYSDIIINATNGMKNGKVRCLPIRWLLVDEYQDSDPIQYEWIITQAKIGNTEVTVVGDDDQSIYAWRSAMGYEGIKQFRKDNDAEQILLSTNYRCGKKILEKALNLIAYNTDRVSKPIKAFEGNPDGVVDYYIAQDRISEAELVRDLIIKDPKGWAILARTNRLLDEIEIVLNLASIPVNRISGDGFWDQEGSQMILQLCNTIANNKWFGLSHFLNNFKCSVEQIEILHAWLGKKPCTKWEFGKRRKGVPDVVNEYFPTGDMNSQESLKLIKLISEWSILEKEKFTDLVLLGISTWAEDYAPKRFRSSCRAASNSILKLKGSLLSRVQFIEGLIDKKLISENDVNLVTLHSSKGMEFDNVAIIAVEQGNCPSLKNIQLEEERRLAYVGFTRAKKRLVITRTIELSESIFIQEAGLTVNFS